MATTRVTTGPETYGQKVWRKLKEEPLIPIGTVLTCVALIQASRNMNRGNRDTMNRWLRARVVFQGAVIVSLLGYSYFRGFGRFAKKEVVTDDAERKLIAAEQERGRFEARLQEVTEMHEMETRGGSQMDGMLGAPPPPPQPSGTWSRIWPGRKG